MAQPTNVAADGRAVVGAEPVLPPAVGVATVVAEAFVLPLVLLRVVAEAFVLPPVLLRVVAEAFVLPPVLLRAVAEAFVLRDRERYVLRGIRSVVAKAA